MNFTKHFMKEYHHHHHRLLQKIEVKEAFPTQIWKNLQIFQRKQNCTPTSLMNPDAKFVQFSSVQFSLVTQSCLTLCDPMNRSTPGLPVHHPLPESTQTHVYCVRDAIKPSHPLSSTSFPALNLSQHQGLFK